MLSASRDWNMMIVWYKNGGGSPPTWTPYTISTSNTYTPAQSVFAADIDGDSRVDGKYVVYLDPTWIPIEVHGMTEIRCRMMELTVPQIRRLCAWLAQPTQAGSLFFLTSCQ